MNRINSTLISPNGVREFSMIGDKQRILEVKTSCEDKQVSSLMREANLDSLDNGSRELTSEEEEGGKVRPYE